jgi:hypothetical protein
MYGRAHYSVHIYIRTGRSIKLTGYQSSSKNDVAGMDHAQRVGPEKEDASILVQERRATVKRMSSLQPL